MRTVLLLWLFLATSGLAQELGVVGPELPSQIGVFSLKLLPGASVKPGDIVSVQRDGAKLGEATVLRVDGPESAVISLKGVFATRAGDRVEFARSAVAPAPTASTSPLPTGLATKMLTSCPTCHGKLTFVRISPNQKLKNPMAMDYYVCPKGHRFWPKDLMRI